jgi:hypothetical protein
MAYSIRDWVRAEEDELPEAIRREKQRLEAEGKTVLVGMDGQLFTATSIPMDYSKFQVKTASIRDIDIQYILAGMDHEGND